jgi:SAM-dependent methyltransferase
MKLHLQAAVVLGAALTGYVLQTGKWVLVAGLLYEHMGWFRTLLAQNARAPSNNPMGWLVQRAMAQMNAERSVMIVDILDPPPQSSVVVELGPGNGHSLEHLVEKYHPSRVYGVEISERFRATLERKFAKEIHEQGILSIHNQDAKELDFLNDASVDGGVYALNVIYFLDPLSDYLKEIYRILRPGSKVVFGVNEEAKDFNDGKYFVNTDWEECLRAMEKAGFISVEMATPQETKVGSPLELLVGVKPE